MSNSWSHGYYADEGYEYGYHTETSPSYLQWMCTLQGIDAPKDNFTYMDLGCGQGLRLIFHAALHPDSQFNGVGYPNVAQAITEWLLQDSRGSVEALSKQLWQ